MPVTRDPKLKPRKRKRKSVTGDKRGAKPDPQSIAGRARLLRVSKQHLHFVLRGQRQSASLMERYKALVAAQAAGNFTSI